MNNLNRSYKRINNFKHFDQMSEIIVEIFFIKEILIFFF